MMPTAISTALPFTANSLNSLIIPIKITPTDETLDHFCSLRYKSFWKELMRAPYDGTKIYLNSKNGTHI
jgi:hypothetical protein